ncbi:hypothetical protein Hanom_Chr16g01466951 [Helianthus anomalus]
MQRFEALSSINCTLLKNSFSKFQNKFLESCDGDDAMVSNASNPSNPDDFRENSIVSSNRSFLTKSQSWTSDQDSIPDAPSEIALENQPKIQDISIKFELEKLRVELKHVSGMYAIAQSKSLDASRKVHCGVVMKITDSSQSLRSFLLSPLTFLHGRHKPNYSKASALGPPIQ